MKSDAIKSRDEALIFVVECGLATIEHLSGLARPPKGELQRQISIAQTGINWIMSMEDRPRCPRVDDVIGVGGSVEAWVNGRGERR